jgi:tetratricopeptide (TPR) repeat protein
MALMPTNAVPYNGRAKAQGALGRPYTALRYMNRAIALNGKYTAAYRNRALILRHLERDDDALADYERLIGLLPEDAELYVERGQIYLRQDKQQTALKDFTKAIELDGENALAFDQRGAANAARRQYEAALDDLNQALVLDSKLADAYYHRADVQVRLGEPDKAASDIAKALTLDPNFAEVYKLRGEIAEGKGDTQAAIDDYRKALSLDPFLKGGPEALKHLTGVDEPVAVPMREQVKGWEIISPSRGRYVAINSRYPQLKALLEMHGAGEPEILEWTVLTDALQGFGLLRYAAGQVPNAPGASDRYEFIVIADLRKNHVVSIEPYLGGDANAKWEWTQATVTITDAEGLSSVHELRPPAPVVVQRPRQPSPWDDGWGRSRGGGWGGGGGGLFNWLFR